MQRKQKEMARPTILVGLSLALATLLGLTIVSEQRHPALIMPMVVGVPLFIAGMISLNPHRQRFWMRVAQRIALAGMAIALLGATLIQFAPSQSPPETSGASASLAPMVYSLGLVVFLAAFAMWIQIALRQLMASRRS